MHLSCPNFLIGINVTLASNCPVQLPPQIIMIFILTAWVTNANAQLWRYLNNDSNSEAVSEKLLDEQACSVVTRTAVFYSDTFTYKVREYCLRSFDGSPDKITIFERPFSHSLIIEGQIDSLKILDFYSLVKLHFLRDDLLEVVFSPRGGSDQGYEDVLILGIEKGKIHVALEMLTINEYDILNEYGLYEVRLKLLGQTLHDCQLAVTIHEVRREKDRSKNFDRKKQYALKFDEGEKIFYNQIVHLHGNFKIERSSGDQNRLIDGDYPVINLGKTVYYYVDRRWYERFDDAATGSKTLSRVVEMVF
jgi:hypothetical protein